MAEWTRSEIDEVISLLRKLASPAFDDEPNLAENQTITLETILAAKKMLHDTPVPMEIQNITKASQEVQNTEPVGASILNNLRKRGRPKGSKNVKRKRHT